MSAVLSSPPPAVFQLWGNTLNALLSKEHVEGWDQSLSWCLEQGLDINVWLVENELGERGNALNLACAYECFDLAFWLLEKGAAPDDSEADLNPLAYAVAYKQMDLIEALLQRGANINQADKEGYIPLMLALADEHPSVEVIQTLLDRGANIALKDKQNRTIFEQMDQNTPIAARQVLEGHQAKLDRHHLHTITALSRSHRSFRRI